MEIKTLSQLKKLCEERRELDEPATLVVDDVNYQLSYLCDNCKSDGIFSFMIEQGFIFTVDTKKDIKRFFVDWYFDSHALDTIKDEIKAEPYLCKQHLIRIKKMIKKGIIPSDDEILNITIPCGIIDIDEPEVLELLPPKVLKGYQFINNLLAE